jgi:hypothetical protein
MGGQDGDRRHDGEDAVRGRSFGPQAALIAESFTGRLRYSGASLGYQLASIIAGRRR